MQHKPRFSGILLVAVPKASETVQLIWVMVSYNLYYAFAATIYNMSHGLMVALSTRNTNERGSLSVFNNVATICRELQENEARQLGANDT